MGTIRLGKRTDARSPKIKEFVPLASLNDLVFTGWDIFEDNMYAAAVQGRRSGTPAARSGQALPVSSIKPRKAVFDHNYVKKLDGPNVKKGKNKMDLAEQLRARHPRLQENFTAQPAWSPSGAARPKRLLSRLQRISR